MRPFTRLTGIAAPLPLNNIDTDMLLPAAFLKTVSRRGLGQALFHAQRFAPDGTERPEFVLNRPPWRRAEILITLDNLGCGSSREHAPWALLDFGLRCLIAPSFAEIFQTNCAKNGILALALPRDQVDVLLADASEPATACMTVDLADRRLTRQGGAQVAFDVDERLRERLRLGLDDIARTLALSPTIGAYEAARDAISPWAGAIPEMS